jgi:thioredoxin reductase (NADPH)
MSSSAQAITIYGASWCLDCRRTKQFLGEHHINYKWVDIERLDAAAAKLSSLTNGSKTIPTVVLPDGQVLIEPSSNQLADALGLPVEPITAYNDLTIIGAGPTGLSAAIYTTREDIKTVIYDRSIAGGLAGITDTIDNYPGFPDGVSGIKLAEDMEKQARRFGAEIITGSAVTGIADEGKYKKITTSQGDHYAKSVLIATGSDYRKLGIPDEKDFIGRGIHYCATCDGPLYRGKRLVVIGGGNSAMQESIFLTKFASKIVLLVRGPILKGSEILIEKIKSLSNIEIHYNVSTTGIEQANGRISAVSGLNSQTGKPVEFDAEGVFVFIGLIPNTGWLKGIVELDQYGFIITDKTFQTSRPGVFAAGDVRSGATLQIASAVGEGVTAALMIREYLKEEG